MEFLTKHWEMIALVVLIVQNVIKGVRDAIDVTPESDDTKFEKIASIITKATGYIIGFRPKK